MDSRPDPTTRPDLYVRSDNDLADIEEHMRNTHIDNEMIIKDLDLDVESLFGDITDDEIPSMEEWYEDNPDELENIFTELDLMNLEIGDEDWESALEGTMIDRYEAAMADL